jgi:hypothetical protein
MSTGSGAQPLATKQVALNAKIKGSMRFAKYRVCTVPSALLSNAEAAKCPDFGRFPVVPGSQRSGTFQKMQVRRRIT